MGTRVGESYPLLNGAFRYLSPGCRSKLLFEPPTKVRGLAEDFACSGSFEFPGIQTEDLSKSLDVLSAVVAVSLRLDLNTWKSRLANKPAELRPIVEKVNKLLQFREDLSLFLDGHRSSFSEYSLQGNCCFRAIYADRKKTKNKGAEFSKICAEETQKTYKEAIRSPSDFDAVAAARRRHVAWLVIRYEEGGMEAEKVSRLLETGTMFSSNGFEPSSCRCEFEALKDLLLRVPCSANLAES
eukprot:5444272-Amphidinium_carterae.1